MAEVVKSPGHLLALYTYFKGYLPQTQNYEFVNRIDSGITRVAVGCDNVVESTFDTVKSIAKKVPTPAQAYTCIAKTSNQELERIEKNLDSFVVYLGGKVNRAEHENKNAFDKVLIILERMYQASTLIVQNTKNRTVGYIKQPTTLLADGGEWLRARELELSAFYLTMRKLVLQSWKQVLAKINAIYKETSTKITLLITDLKNPEKATQMVSERFFWVKRVTVRAVKRGIEVVVDKKHYYDNLEKLFSFVTQTVGDVLMNLEEKFDVLVSDARQLYESTVRNYKIQKIILENQRNQELAAAEKHIEYRKGEAPTSASGADEKEKSVEFQTPKAKEEQIRTPEKKSDEKSNNEEEKQQEQEREKNEIRESLNQQNQ